MQYRPFFGEFPISSGFSAVLARHQLVYLLQPSLPAFLAAGLRRPILAATRRAPIREKDLKGLKYFKLITPLLERLHKDATKRDRAGNRRLFYDQYASLLLVYFFNPILTSLRGIQQASGLDKVQRLVGCQRVALGSLSEASRVFNPELLQTIISELAAQAIPVLRGQQARTLRGLEAVDGSLLRALPKMAWALWRQDQKNRAIKMHVTFNVLKNIPTRVRVTAANDSERDQFRDGLKAGGFYVIDRGYRDWALFEQISAAGASFVCRVQENTVIDAYRERPVRPAAQAAGVLRDVLIKRAGNKGRVKLRHPLRLLVIDTGKRLLNGKPELLVLCTNRLKLSALLVALAYKYRWTVELFFRWLKCILGCRHLLANSRPGVTMQIYMAIIASLLISLWIGRKPTLRTLEMLQFYFSGWATEDELLAHLAQRKTLTK